MKFDEADKTPWFPGTVAPEHEGVYERRYCGDDADIDASCFVGDLWYRGRLTIDDALSERLVSGYQVHEAAKEFEWRGLAQDPNATAVTHVPPQIAEDDLGPGLALDSGEFIPAAELNAQPVVDAEEDLF